MEPLKVRTLYLVEHVGAQIKIDGNNDLIDVRSANDEGGYFFLQLRDRTGMGFSAKLPANVAPNFIKEFKRALRAA